MVMSIAIFIFSRLGNFRVLSLWNVVVEQRENEDCNRDDMAIMLGLLQKRRF